MQSVEILSDLIAFPTISADPNRELIEYCKQLLSSCGAEVTIIENATGTKANLYATIGPSEKPGVLLSGHTDVVPVEGQSWSTSPFKLSEKDGKLFGRGCADMKGFVACALSLALKAKDETLTTPLHIALSYDEEIGCVGVRSLIDMLETAPFKPQFCIVGEPTSMGVATGHKGKTACQVICHGRAAHSALAPDGLNAIYLACDLISEIRGLQREIESNSSHDDDYEVPYTTLHIGELSGGVALNIVPSEARFSFEIRNLPEDDPESILAEIRTRANQTLEPLHKTFPEAKIDIEVTNQYPPLSTAKDASVVNFVKSITGQNATFKVAFGTEGGLFSSRVGIPTVICGPGSMEQGHKPNEYVTKEQLMRCDEMLDQLLQRLIVGL